MIYRWWVDLFKFYLAAHTVSLAVVFTDLFNQIETLFRGFLGYCPKGTRHRYFMRDNIRGIPPFIWVMVKAMGSTGATERELMLCSWSINRAAMST